MLRSNITNGQKLTNKKSSFQKGNFLEERKANQTGHHDDLCRQCLHKYTFNYWVTNRSTKHDPIDNPFTDDEKSLTVLDYRIEIRYSDPVIKPHSQHRFVIT